ncbi:hypothetical protein ACJX0J_036351, partial [Zea mays]
ILDNDNLKLYLHRDFLMKFPINFHVLVIFTKRKMNNHNIHETFTQDLSCGLPYCQVFANIHVRFALSQMWLFLVRHAFLGKLFVRPLSHMIRVEKPTSLLLHLIMYFITSFLMLLMLNLDWQWHSLSLQINHNSGTIVFLMVPTFKNILKKTQQKEKRRDEKNRIGQAQLDHTGES